LEGDQSARRWPPRCGAGGDQPAQWCPLRPDVGDSGLAGGSYRARMDAPRGPWESGGGRRPHEPTQAWRGWPEEWPHWRPKAGGQGGARARSCLRSCIKLMANFATETRGEPQGRDRGAGGGLQILGGVTALAVRHRVGDGKTEWGREAGAWSRVRLQGRRCE
jgi:hypothetical protein